MLLVKWQIQGLVGEQLRLSEGVMPGPLQQPGRCVQQLVERQAQELAEGRLQLSEMMRPGPFPHHWCCVSHPEEW